MNIIQMLNTNSFPRADHPRFVILHGTAGGTSAQAIAQYFQGAGVSAHYVIGQDGQIVQCNRESDGAWADGIIDGIPTAGLPFRTQSDGVHRDDWWDPNGTNPNNLGIAIEHCKPSTDNSDELTPAQKAASFWLVNDICTRHGIPKRFADANGGITGHFSIDAVSRQRCPGTYPWQELFDYLNEEQSMSIDLSNPVVAQYFSATQDPQIWLCTRNGFLLGHGILSFYQKFGGDALCGLSYLGLPKSSELPVAGHPGVTQQEFERATVRYDPSKVSDNPPGASDCYLVHVEQDPRYVALQAEIATLTQPAQLLQQLNGLIAQASTANAQIGAVLTQAAKLSQVQ